LASPAVRFLSHRREACVEVRGSDAGFAAARVMIVDVFLEIFYCTSIVYEIANPGIVSNE
jgi:hypothetical protein